MRPHSSHSAKAGTDPSRTIQPNCQTRAFDWPFNPLMPTVVMLGTAIKHPLSDRVKPGTLTLSRERQSARMSKMWKPIETRLLYVMCLDQVTRQLE